LEAGQYRNITKTVNFITHKSLARPLPKSANTSLMAASALQISEFRLILKAQKAIFLTGPVFG
jgi:hypothetical protein